MKKIGVYIGLVVVGLIAGYFLFRNSAADNSIKKESRENAATSPLPGRGIGGGFTCSMHPQIHKTEPGDCPICGMELIPQQTESGKISPNEFKLTKTAMALANVETSVVENSAAAGGSLELSGKIEANEKANVAQVAYFSGRLEKLNINSTGEKIRRGQLLATVYSPELVSAQQELLTAASAKKSNPGLYKAVRNKLKSWKLSDKQINQIEKSGKTQNNFSIYATTSGTVTQKMVSEGDYLKKGQVMFKIADLSTVWGIFDAYENQINQLQKGQNITIASKAYPGKTVQGKIDFIEPTLNSATRTVKVRSVLDNKNGQFKPGMFIKGTVQNKKMANAEKILSIPKSAVLWTGKRSVVYVQPNPKKSIFELREVELGNETSDSYQILSGLKKGDEIVTNGTFTVDAAAQLQGKPSMMDNKKAENMAKKTGGMAPMHKNPSEAFQQKFVDMLQPYLQLKDAFVAGNSTKISTLAKKMLTEIQSTSMAGFRSKETTHISTMSANLEKIIRQQNLVNQRKYFVFVNKHLVALMPTLNQVDLQLYIQKCPMANNNKGAIWLSKEHKIENPYYGKAMLSCGSVIKTITNEES